MAGNICDVCRRSPVVGVASSPLGPVSFAYCEECLVRGAQPMYLASFLVEDAGGLQNCAEWLASLPVWKDGKYTLLKEAL
jgi:hypothetical protein